MIPNKSDQFWIALVTGESAYKCYSMPASMLMAKVIRSVQRDASPTNVQKNIEEVYNFFIRYADKLQQDIQGLSDISRRTAEKHIPQPSDAKEKLSFPARTDPFWQLLVTGQQQYKFQTMPASMLMTKIIRNIQRDNSKIVIEQSIDELYSFFVRYRDKLKADLYGIALLARTLRQPTKNKPDSHQASYHLPDLHHPVWKMLVTGEIPLTCKALSTNTLLTKQIRSVQRDPSLANIQKASEELYRFFHTNQNLLLDDIRTLLNLQHTTTPVKTTTSTPTKITTPAPSADTQPLESSLPPPTDPIWKSLVTGEKIFNSQNPTVNLMLQRLQQSVQRDPSSTNLLKRIEEVHHFFVRYQSTLKKEITALFG